MSPSRVMKVLFLFLAAVGITCIVTCAGSGDVQPRSYKGHEDDFDMKNFVNVYRNTVGTRLDDCQTCHKSVEMTDTSGKKVQKNQCDYCHLIRWPDTSLLNPPVSYADTLNPYGLIYLQNGQSGNCGTRTSDNKTCWRNILKTMGGTDSDGDSYTDSYEASGGYQGYLYYPGDSNSHPPQMPAPSKIMTMNQIAALSAHSEFLLSNTTQQRYDSYITYKGVKISDLLAYLGVDLNSADFVGITVVSPDGFTKSFMADKVRNQYPTQMYYHGLDQATMGQDCGFVEYPNPSPMHATGPIAGEQWMILGYKRDDGAGYINLDKVTLDVSTGKINGEGPYRLIVPQSTPGSPDRGSKYPMPSCADSYGFDPLKDHNAGDMARGVVAIRVDPLPSGYEDFDYKNGGWAMVEAEQVIIYGFGIK